MPGLGEGTFLITTVFVNKVSHYPWFNAAAHCANTWITWDMKNVLRVKRKEKRTVILQTGDDVNIFNGGSQLGSGKVLSISDEGKAKILVEKIHKANVEQIPSLQFNIGMEIEWSVLFLGKRQDLPQKEARKITQKQKIKEEKKSKKGLISLKKILNCVSAVKSVWKSLKRMIYKENEIFSGV